MTPLSSKPFVSVIIPVYNDEYGIQDTLKSLQQQDYPPDKWEVIVVDNNSTDQTRNFAQLLLKHIPSSQITTETKQSSYAARNKGIKTAKGDIIAFCDSDITVAHDWITKGVDDIIRQNADYVGCRIKMIASDNPSIWELYNQAIGFPVEHYINDLHFSPTAALFVKKSVIDKIGIFDDRLISGGDYEFGTRVWDSGSMMYYSENNFIYHPARKTFTSLLKKNIRGSKGYIDLRFLYPGRFGSVSLYSVFIYFIIIPTNVQQCFRSLPFIDRAKIYAIRLLFHYTGTLSRLYYYFSSRSSQSLGPAPSNQNNSRLS